MVVGGTRRKKGRKKEKQGTVVSPESLLYQASLTVTGNNMGSCVDLTCISTLQKKVLLQKKVYRIKRENRKAKKERPDPDPKGCS